MTYKLKTVQDYIDLPTVEANHRISYGKHSEQFGDLYLPKLSPSKKHPIIILIHGGCWQSQFNLSPLGQLSKSLTKIGYAVWNLEFRRLGNGGGWPITFQDIALGADTLNNIAKEYSLDLNNITSMGHSAGGHLALWLAGRHHLPEDSLLRKDKPLQIHRVISLAGIPNLNTGVAEEICRGACEEFVGGLPGEIPEIYLQASPHNLLPLNIPQWHLVGENDPIVPTKYLEPYIATAKQHDETYYQIIPKIGHFEMVIPETAACKYIENILELHEIA